MANILPWQDAVLGRRRADQTNWYESIPLSNACLPPYTAFIYASFRAIANAAAKNTRTTVNTTDRMDDGRLGAVTAKNEGDSDLGCIARKGVDLVILRMGNERDRGQWTSASLISSEFYIICKLDKLFLFLLCVYVCREEM